MAIKEIETDIVFEIYKSCTLVEDTGTFIKIEKIIIPEVK